MNTVTITNYKSNEVEFPVLDAIENRKSKRAYSSQPIEKEKIESLFEAARWAPSSMNEQPWTYIYATKDQPELWNKLAEALYEGNRVWAQHAPLLILSMARKTHIRNGAVNGAAKYDTGAANAFLSLQATELGLNVHQMGGFDRQRVVESLNIPDSHEPIVIMAIGYLGDAESLPENFKARETAPRERYTQEFFVMNKPF